MAAKSPQRIEAERLCREFPETATKTLAKKLSASHQITIEQARTTLRRARGNAGEAERKFATSPRPNGIAGTKPAIPPSLAEPWLPFELGNDHKILVLSDAHVPIHSVLALTTAVARGVQENVDVVLLNGDWADVSAVSRHPKNPAKRNILGELELVKQSLSWLRGEFPSQRIVFKFGNHEERWQHWLWNSAPEICDVERMTLEKWIDTDSLGIEIVKDHRPVMAGRLPIFHGHEIGKGISAPVNTARGAFLRTTSTMLQGHSHRTSQHVEPDWRHIDTACWSTGCLCDLNPEYARVNKWNHGFAIVTVEHNGGYHVDNLRISSDGEIW